jgi:acyl-CoA thioester hydrolase
MFGHVNNTTVFTYFEEARIEFFKSIGLMQNWLKPESKLIPVVADLQCDYLAQTYFDELLQVYVKVNQIGSTSIDLHYFIQKQDGTPAFVGRGTVVQISKENGKPEVWDDHCRQCIEESIEHLEYYITK